MQRIPVYIIHPYSIINISQKKVTINEYFGEPESGDEVELYSNEVELTEYDKLLYYDKYNIPIDSYKFDKHNENYIRKHDPELLLCLSIPPPDKECKKIGYLNILDESHKDKIIKKLEDDLYKTPAENVYSIQYSSLIDICNSCAHERGVY